MGTFLVSQALSGENPVEIQTTLSHCPEAHNWHKGDRV